MIPADVWMDNAVYKDNTVFWEFNIAPHRPKVVAWTRMLVEMSISEREWNTFGRKNQKTVVINGGDKRIKNDFSFLAGATRGTVMSFTEVKNTENLNHELLHV